ncbi:MAG: AAA family ATPase [Caldilineaceae bacterium]
MSSQPTIILITGHPAAGKSTLARYLAAELRWPLICKDAIKETLCDTVGCGSDEDSRRLSIAAWTLLYAQTQELLRSSVSHIVESNFTPAYANSRWQRFAESYPFRLIQLRCEADGETLMQRYRDRIASGERHPGHVDDSADPALRELLWGDPPGWIDLPGERLTIDTGTLAPTGYQAVLRQLQPLMHGMLRT